MDVVASAELRLLMCSLAGSPPSNSEEQGIPAPSLDAAISHAVSSIENGAFLDALSAPPVKSLLWEGWIDSLQAAKDANEFYTSVGCRVLAFINGGEDRGDCTNGLREGHGDCAKDLRDKRCLLVMAVGVAALLAFWQANLTGPCMDFPPCSFIILPGARCAINDHEGNEWAKKQLMVDGSDLVGLCYLPQYLILARIFLVDTLDSLKGAANAAILLCTWSWWACRTLFAHQLALDERSPSLYAAMAALKPEAFLALKEMKWGAALDKNAATIITTAVQLEYSLVEYAYSHVDHAKKRVEAAKEACGLQLRLTGALGYRTVHQINPKAQMVLIADTKSETNEQAPCIVEKANTDTSENGQKGFSTEEDILMMPKLIDDEVLTSNQSGMHKALSSLQQAVILAECLDIKRSNPDDELRAWQMAPFIEAVDGQQSSQFMVKCCCQLLRIRWEYTRSRTKQRALLMMEQLVEDIRENATCEVQNRMHYAFCINFPTLAVLLKEYAEMMVGCGLVRDALSIFKQLELWNSLIDCYCLLGKKAAAVDLINERLQHSPNDPRLWCALGDVTLNEECYVKAWEVSGHHFARAQRSLGRSAYNKGEYVNSIKHWEAALSLNSLHPDGWFALGSAALKARELNKALDAYTRAVQLDPDNGEAWNNIAAIHMTKKKSKEAFTAFREALKFKRNSWQMWENYAYVSLDVCNFGQAIEALNMVLDLSEGKHINLACLSKLIEELELRSETDRSMSSLRQNEASEPKGDAVRDDSISSAREDGNARIKEELMAETDWLMNRVGKLLTRVLQHCQDAAVWGLLARWHRLKGDLTMCSEALLKQVRSLQGSDWQHSKEHFERFCQAALKLCEMYIEISSRTGSKKELSSARMLLRSILRQGGESFSKLDEYLAVESCYKKLEDLFQSL